MALSSIRFIRAPYILQRSVLKRSTKEELSSYRLNEENSNRVNSSWRHNSCAYVLTYFRLLLQICFRGAGERDEHFLVDATHCVEFFAEFSPELERGRHEREIRSCCYDS